MEGYRDSNLEYGIFCFIYVFKVLLHHLFSVLFILFCLLILTLKVPITAAADDIHKYIFFVSQRK